MNDRIGNPLKVGAKVYVLPGKIPGREGGIGYVRKILPNKVRVDNDPPGAARA